MNIRPSLVPCPLCSLGKGGERSGTVDMNHFDMGLRASHVDANHVDMYHIRIYFLM